MRVAQFLWDRTIREATLVLGAALAVSGIATAAEPARPVTFAKDVAPILQQKCQDCHQPGSIAPMSLRTYEETRPWARAIKDRVMKRQMPPWHIDKTVGVQKFKNDMSLTDEQVNMIRHYDRDVQIVLCVVVMAAAGKDNVPVLIGQHSAILRHKCNEVRLVVTL